MGRVYRRGEGAAGNDGIWRQEDCRGWEGAASCELRMDMAGATGLCQLTAQ
jgi:hypothetical protein